MDYSGALEKVKGVLTSPPYCIDEGQITDDTTFAQLGLEPLDVFRVLGGVEDLTGLDLTGEFDPDGIKSLRQVAEYVEQASKAGE